MFNTIFTGIVAFSILSQRIYAEYGWNVAKSRILG